MPLRCVPVLGDPFLVHAGVRTLSRIVVVAAHLTSRSQHDEVSRLCSDVLDCILSREELREPWLDMQIVCRKTGLTPKELLHVSEKEQTKMGLSDEAVKQATSLVNKYKDVQTLPLGVRVLDDGSRTAVRIQNGLQITTMENLAAWTGKGSAFVTLVMYYGVSQSPPPHFIQCQDIVLNHECLFPPKHY